MLARLALAAGISLAPAALAQQPWLPYSVQHPGFYDSEHLGSSNNSYHQLLFLTPTGIGAGYSARILGVSTLNGNDAWAWNGSITIPLGYSGGVYRSPSGKQNTFLTVHNDAGFIAGRSDRFGSSTLAIGSDAWLWNGSVTIPLGFTGGPYTSPAGAQGSSPAIMNAAGSVVGHSTRFTNGTPNGQDAWLWNGFDAPAPRLHRPRLRGLRRLSPDRRRRPERRWMGRRQHQPCRHGQ